eukprot:scaffold82449_cov64-Phaeocystis_antarctica.AAC.1
MLCSSSTASSSARRLNRKASVTSGVASDSPSDGGAVDDPAVLDGAPGGSEGGGEPDGAGPPASLEAVSPAVASPERWGWLVPACRPRRMASRLLSSWGRRCT